MAEVQKQFRAEGADRCVPTTMGRGLLWTGVEKTFGQVVGFVQGIILARLLCPEDFGLAAMLGIFLSVGITLSDSGLGNALIAFGATRRTERRVLAWNICVSLFLYVALVAFAPLIASFYRQPVLRELVWVMALCLPLNAACVVGSARMNRNMRFVAFSCLNIVLDFSAFVVGLVLAFAGWGVWAIAWMNVFWGAARLILLSFVAFRDEPSSGRDGERPFREMLAYGIKLSAGEVIGVAYGNCFALVIGKAFGAGVVGIYNRGLRWSQLAGDVVNSSVARISLVALSRGKVRAVRFAALNVVLVWPCLLALGLFAPQVVRLVLGEDWLPCVPYLRILLVGAAFAPFNIQAVNVLKATGRAGALLGSEALKRPLALAFLCIGVSFGVTGVCWAKVAGDVLEAAVDCFLAMRVRRQA